MTKRQPMVLVDTNAISEVRKGEQADPGVLAPGRSHPQPSADLSRRRDDRRAPPGCGAKPFSQMLSDCGDWVLSPQHALGKQIAAMALLHDLTVVTCNTGDVITTGVSLLNHSVMANGLTIRAHAANAPCATATTEGGKTQRQKLVSGQARTQCCHGGPSNAASASSPDHT